MMKNGQEQGRTFEASLEALEQIVRQLGAATCRSRKASSCSSKAFVFRESVRNA